MIFIQLLESYSDNPDGIFKAGDTIAVDRELADNLIWSGVGREYKHYGATFKVKLADLLDANAQYLEHVERTHGGLIELYASKPAETCPPIRVKKNLVVRKGFRRLLAARRRGDAVVLCYPATLQEELSA